MPRARSIKDRIAQVEQWLREEFPPAYPVKVRWVGYVAPDPDDLHTYTARERAIGDAAVTWYARKRFTINLSERSNARFDVAIDTILHEWAHCRAVRGGKMERHRVSDHDDEYWLEFGRIYRAFQERGGSEASRKFSF